MSTAKQSFAINGYAFLVGFAVGLLYVYIATPHKRVTVRYPNPYNSGNVIYHDQDSPSCYTYESKTVTCPAMGTKPQPLM